MARTLDLLKAQLGEIGVGAQMELLVLKTETQEIIKGTPTVITLPAGASRLLLKSIRVTASHVADEFEVEILATEDGDIVEYASLTVAKELYDIVDLPYICAKNNIYLRITPAESMSFDIEIRALKLS